MVKRRDDNTFTFTAADLQQAGARGEMRAGQRVGKAASVGPGTWHIEIVRDGPRVVVLPLSRGVVAFAATDDTVAFRLMVTVDDRNLIITVSDADPPVSSTRHSLAVDDCPAPIDSFLDVLWMPASDEQHLTLDLLTARLIDELGRLLQHESELEAALERACAERDEAAEQVCILRRELENLRAAGATSPGVRPVVVKSAAAIAAAILGVVGASAHADGARDAAEIQATAALNVAELQSESEYAIAELSAEAMRTATQVQACGP